ncbi:hypothetical protein [Chitinilyticum litopenaei]|uniref:hypothetical protein n=1 Tax=Chitinilyticum litopenaei TaxID=1121276 RepID=UPI001184AC85|nr:hypothetical protein [Chitinilyticum litopenaei]
MSDETILYKIIYKEDTLGCPIHWAGEWNIESLYWDPLDPKTYKPHNGSHLELYLSYVRKLDADFGIDAPMIASEKLRKILDLLSIPHYAIPLEILIRGKKRSEKDYYIILPTTEIHLLDMKNLTSILSKISTREKSCTKMEGQHAN